MLILTVKRNDPIRIINLDTGEVSLVEVLSNDHGQYRVGISAPDNYNILRDKVYKKQEQKNVIS